MAGVNRPSACNEIQEKEDCPEPSCSFALQQSKCFLKNKTRACDNDVGSFIQESHSLS